MREVFFATSTTLNPPDASWNNNSEPAKKLIQSYFISNFQKQNCLLFFINNIGTNFFYYLAWSGPFVLISEIISLSDYITLLLFKKFSSEKGILARLGLEPTSPCSPEKIAGALDHSTTTTCWEIKLNNRIYNYLKLATTPKELKIHQSSWKLFVS